MSSPVHASICAEDTEHRFDHLKLQWICYITRDVAHCSSARLCDYGQRKSVGFRTQVTYTRSLCLALRLQSKQASPNVHYDNPTYVQISRIDAEVPRGTSDTELGPSNQAQTMIDDRSFSPMSRRVMLVSFGKFALPKSSSSSS